MSTEQARVFVNEHPTEEAVRAHASAHPISERGRSTDDPAAYWLFKAATGRPVVVAVGWWEGDEGEGEPPAADIEAASASYCGFLRFTQTNAFTWRPLTAEGLPLDMIPPDVLEAIDEIVDDNAERCFCMAEIYAVHDPEEDTPSSRIEDAVLVAANGLKALRLLTAPVPASVYHQDRIDRAEREGRGLCEADCHECGAKADEGPCKAEQ